MSKQLIDKIKNRPDGFSFEEVNYIFAHKCRGESVQTLGVLVTPSTENPKEVSPGYFINTVKTRMANKPRNDRWLAGFVQSYQPNSGATVMAALMIDTKDIAKPTVYRYEIASRDMARSEEIRQSKTLHECLEASLPFPSVGNHKYQLTHNYALKTTKDDTQLPLWARQLYAIYAAAKVIKHKDGFVRLPENIKAGDILKKATSMLEKYSKDKEFQKLARNDAARAPITPAFSSSSLININASQPPSSQSLLTPVTSGSNNSLAAAVPAYSYYTPAAAAPSAYPYSQATVPAPSQAQSAYYVPAAATPAAAPSAYPYHVVAPTTPISSYSPPQVRPHANFDSSVALPMPPLLQKATTAVAAPAAADPLFQAVNRPPTPAEEEAERIIQGIEHLFIRDAQGRTPLQNVDCEITSRIKQLGNGQQLSLAEKTALHNKRQAANPLVQIHQQLARNIHRQASFKGNSGPKDDEKFDYEDAMFQKLQTCSYLPSPNHLTLLLPTTRPDVANAQSINAYVIDELLNANNDSTVRRICIPYNPSEDHWVGIVIEKPTTPGNPGNHYHFVVLDPLAQQHDNYVKHLAELLGLRPSEYIIDTLEKRYQNEAYLINCGPLAAKLVRDYCELMEQTNDPSLAVAILAANAQRFGERDIIKTRLEQAILAGDYEILIQEINNIPDTQASTPAAAIPASVSAFAAKPATAPAVVITPAAPPPITPAPTSWQQKIQNAAMPVTPTVVAPAPITPAPIVPAVPVPWIYRDCQEFLNFKENRTAGIKDAFSLEDYLRKFDKLLGETMNRYPLGAASLASQGHINNLCCWVQALILSTEIVSQVTTPQRKPLYSHNAFGYLQHIGIKLRTIADHLIPLQTQAFSQYNTYKDYFAIGMCDVMSSSRFNLQIDKQHLTTQFSLLIGKDPTQPHSNSTSTSCEILLNKVQQSIDSIQSRPAVSPRSSSSSLTP